MTYAMSAAPTGIPRLSSADPETQSLLIEYNGRAACGGSAAEIRSVVTRTAESASASMVRKSRLRIGRVERNIGGTGFQNREHRNHHLRRPLETNAHPLAALAPRARSFRANRFALRLSSA